MEGRIQNSSHPINHSYPFFSSLSWIFISMFLTMTQFWIFSNNANLNFNFFPIFLNMGPYGSKVFKVSLLRVIPNFSWFFSSRLLLYKPGPSLRPQNYKVILGSLSALAWKWTVTQKYHTEKQGDRGWDSLTDKYILYIWGYLWSWSCEDAILESFSAVVSELVHNMEHMCKVLIPISTTVV